MINIYRIINSCGSTVYVGSTEKKLETRFKQHLKDVKLEEKYEYLQNNNCEIVLIKQVEESERFKIEQVYIDFYKPILNQIRAKRKTEKEALKDAKNIIKNLNKPKKDFKFNKFNKRFY